MILTIDICLMILLAFANAQLKFPNVTLEALVPRGIRVTVQSIPGLQKFSFHGNNNKRVDFQEVGEFFGDIIKANENNRWTYENLSVNLQPGDDVYYWIYYQVNGLGYRTKKEQWKVTAEYDSFGQINELLYEDVRDKCF